MLGALSSRHFRLFNKLSREKHVIWTAAIVNEYGNESYGAMLAGCAICFASADFRLE